MVEYLLNALIGTIGVVIGTILSTLLGYRLQNKLIKQKFVLEEKMRQYEKISDKVNQIYELLIKAINLDEKERKTELPRRATASKEVFNYFLILNPPNFNYVSKNIKVMLFDFKKYLERIADNENYSKGNIKELDKNIKYFTNRIKKQIRKELK